MVDWSSRKLKIRLSGDSPIISWWFNWKKNWQCVIKNISTAQSDSMFIFGTSVLQHLVGQKKKSNKKLWIDACSPLPQSSILLPVWASVPMSLCFPILGLGNQFQYLWGLVMHLRGPHRCDPHQEFAHVMCCMWNINICRDENIVFTSFMSFINFLKWVWLSWKLWSIWMLCNMISLVWSVT